MTSEKNKELLPVGTEIDFQGWSLIITARIGEGFTSQVYDGQLESGSGVVHVAAKAMKAMDLADARQRFHQEGETLAYLMELEDKANQKQRVSIKVAPIYYGRSVYEGVDYLVMEFIEGEQLPDLLLNRGSLLEREALTAAWHFYRTLDLLHSDLRKTFVDMKFENLWWMQDPLSGEGQLKVTDFGTLAEIRGTSTTGIERDLLHAGIILFNLLTGYRLRYSIHGLREEVTPLLKNYTLSWGAKEVLKRALHRNPQRRYASANEATKELRMLVDFWRNTDEGLYEIANNNLNEALKLDDLTGDEARDYARRARIALGVIEERSPEFFRGAAQKAIEEADNLLFKSDYLALGVDLLRGGSWEDACKKFDEGKDWSETPAIFRRWSYLARALMNNTIPREIFEDTREKLFEVIDRMNEGRWAEARVWLESFASYLNPQGLEFLLAECELFTRMAEAEKNRQKAMSNDRTSYLFSEALAQYQQAYAALYKLPDVDFIQRKEIGDLLTLIGETEHLSKTRGEAARLYAKASELLAANDLQAGIARIADAVAADPEYPGLVDEVLAASDAPLQGLAWPAVFELLELARGAGSGWKILRDRYRLTEILRQAERDIHEQHYESFPQYIQQALEYGAGRPAVAEAARKLTEKAVLSAEKAGRMDALISLRKLVLQILPGNNEAWAEVLQKIVDRLLNQLHGEWRNQVDAQIARAISLIAIDDPQQALQVGGETSLLSVQVLAAQRMESLRRAVQLLDDAAPLANSLKYRTEEIAAHKERALKLSHYLHTAEASRSEEVEAHEKTLRSELEGRWQRYQKLCAWAAEGPASYAVGQVLEAIDLQKARELDELHELARRVIVQVDSQDVQANLILRRAIAEEDNLGMNAWTEVRKKADDRISAAEAALTQARMLFERGDLDAACREVDSQEKVFAGTAEWRELKDRLVVTLSFQAWEKKIAKRLQEDDQPNREILRQAREFIERGLPQAYLDKSACREYHRVVGDKLRSYVKSELRSPADQRFLSLIGDWILLDQTFNRAMKN